MTGIRSLSISFLRIAAIFLTASGLLGCGSSGPPSAILEGTVTVDQAPANSGRVLVTASNGNVTTGTIQPNGSYRVVGLTVGPVQITVLPPENLDSLSAAGKSPHSSGNAGVLDAKGG